MSIKRTTLPQTPPKAAKHSLVLDELSPLSKRLKIELKDINKRECKKRNKASCDTKSEVAVSLTNKHSTPSALGQSRQKQMNIEDGAAKGVNSPKTLLSSSVLSDQIQTGKKLNKAYRIDGSEHLIISPMRKIF